MGSVADRIRSKLNQAFAPVRLDLQDDSAKHSGHSGAREGGESHFSVVIVSEAFKGQSRVARQRQINTVLAEELKGPIHALSIQALAPEEA